MPLCEGTDLQNGTDTHGAAYHLDPLDTQCHLSLEQLIFVNLL